MCKHQELVWVAGLHELVVNGDIVIGSGQLLTVKEVARLLQFTEKGVYSLVENRRIPYVRISNRIRFLQSDVLEWLQENRVSAIAR